MIKVAVDAMGGDLAPVEMVAGAVEAVNAKPGIQVLLVGQEAVVNKELSKYTYNKEQIQVVNATEVIATEEPPVNAIRKKKDSSIVVGMNLVKNKEADAFVSAGSSGAILVGGQVIVGRIKGVERPPLAPLIPTEKGVSLLIDCGANVDARPSHLVQFAQMGSIYMEHVVGIKNPRVAIVNIGAEEEKGNALVKETFPLLKACPDINFIGSIEAREIPHGGADVIVCEAFTGNVILKLYEGVGATLIHMVKQGRIKGVERPPLAPLIPTEKGVSLLIDCGANVDARPSHLVQFAQMGSIYMEHVVGIKNPRVAIVNIGAEEEKGNALVKETFPLLKACPDINFIGSIEAREIPHGGADVIVCEAFTGNVILKLYEGVGATLIHMVKQGMMSTLRSKIGALLVKPALKTTLKAFDASQYGGAPLLGLKGLVVKTHGSSKRTEVRNSIIQCVTFKEQEINEKIKESLTVGNGKTEEMKE